jgi:hypothetical protein
MKTGVAIFALALFVGAPAMAEQCTKDFPNHMMNSDGRFGLYLGNGGAWWYPCSVSTVVNGVTVDACKAALTSYLAAKAQGKPITLSYPGTCAAINGMSTINSDGFYWFAVYW